jgi:hypothetical protein
MSKFHLFYPVAMSSPIVFAAQKPGEQKQLYDEKSFGMIVAGFICSERIQSSLFSLSAKSFINHRKQNELPKV